MMPRRLVIVMQSGVAQRCRTSSSLSRAGGVDQPTMTAVETSVETSVEAVAMVTAEAMVMAVTMAMAAVDAMATAHDRCFEGIGVGDAAAVATVAVTVMAVMKTAVTSAARAMVVVMTAANVTATAATMLVAAAMATVRDGFVEGICVRNAGAGTATAARMTAVTVAARQGRL